MIFLPYISGTMSSANAYGSADISNCIPRTRAVNYRSRVSALANVYTRCEVRENEHFCIEGHDFYSVTITTGTNPSYGSVKTVHTFVVHGVDFMIVRGSS